MHIFLCFLTHKVPGPGLMCKLNKVYSRAENHIPTKIILIENLHIIHNIICSYYLN